MACFLVLLLTFIGLFGKGCSAQIQVNYQQRLEVTDDGLIQISFRLGPDHLPIPLKQRMKKERSSIDIRYGPYFHQHLGSPNPSSTNTITTVLRSQNPISSQLKQIIESVFVISISHRYSFAYHLSQTFFIFNDPNDKFCRHHIEELFRNFLPCGANSGLSQLIDLQKFFTVSKGGKLRYGMRVKWNSTSFVTSIYLQPEVLKRAKVNQKCLVNSQLTILDNQGRQIGVREVVLNRLEESMENKTYQQKQQKLGIIHQLRGTWYNPDKQLQISIKSKRLIQNNSMIIASYVLPSRAGVKLFEIQNFNAQEADFVVNQSCIPRTNDIQPKYKSPSFLCFINVLVRTKIQESSHVSFMIVASMRNKIMCFDQYETIFGGGAELPLLPVLLIEPTQIQRIEQIYAGPLSLKSPQPDQSLPFQVMTFVLAIFGYLWLSVWRKFVSDIKRKNKQFQSLKDD